MKSLKHFLFGALMAVLFAQPHFSQAYPQWGKLKPGTYQVGFRVVEQYDYSRARQPKTNWEGKPATGENALPMQIFLWYPAKTKPNAPRMLFQEYRWLSSKAENFGEITQNDKDASRAGLLNIIRNASGENPNNEQIVRAILETPTAAVRDAEPSEGSFPVLLGGLGNISTVSVLAEYLASHGFVVAGVGSHAKTFTMQVTEPQIALEWQTRNIEYLVPFLRSQKFADTSRLGLIGVNFDGLAALNFQMRNQTADAIVSLDGWEGKKQFSSISRQSPFFDALKFQVPYLLFGQDDPPSAGLQFDPNFFGDFKYSERFYYQVGKVGHIGYVGNPLTIPTQAADERAGVEYVYNTVLHFLNSYVKKDKQSLNFLKNSSEANGSTKDLIAAETRLPALPPVPSAEEFEQLMRVGLGQDGSGIKQGIEIFRAARKANPGLNLFSVDSVRLFGFRMTRQNKPAEAVELLKLGVEAYPQSTVAMNNLGNLYQSLGQKELALESFEKALALVADDSTMNEKDKEDSRGVLQKKIKDLRESK